jgi:tRNA pseudouridine55 synthase
MYSAIKVNGKKLYEYARNGETIKIEPRKIEIYNIELLDVNLTENEIKFKVACSKGTYIRSLCEDIATKLGTVGYMKELNRTKVGIFNIEKAITIDELEKNKNNIDFINENIITMQELFKNYESIQINGKNLEQFLNGVKIATKREDGTYNVYSNDKYIGLAIVKNNLAKRDIIFI